MQQITLNQFEADIRCLRNVIIKSSIVGNARITSYFKGKKVLGLVREYKGVKSYYTNI